MSKSRRTFVALGAALALAASLGGSALAADDPPSFGKHVSTCAREALGDRSNPPAVTCTHDGMSMPFANFGEMVQHLRAMHP